MNIRRVESDSAVLILDACSTALWFTVEGVRRLGMDVRTAAGRKPTTASHRAGYTWSGLASVSGEHR